MKASAKKIAVADVPVSNTFEAFKSLPISLHGLKLDLEFLLIEKPPYYIFIGLLTLEDLHARLAYGRKC